MASPDELDPTATKSFFGHLLDLRKMIVYCAVSLALGILFAVPLTPYVLEVIKYPLIKAGKNPAEFLIVLETTGGVTVALKVMFWSGLLLATPGIILAVADFVFPGLTAKEKRLVRRAGLFAGGLFLVGVALGYFVTLPVALRVMFRINAWIGIETAKNTLAPYVAFVLKLLLAFGLAFELPVIVLACGYMGLVSAKTLREKRPVVIVGLLVLAMLLTPPDPMTQLMMAIPMAILYEFCVWLIRAKEVKDRLMGGDAEPESQDPQ